MLHKIIWSLVFLIAMGAVSIAIMHPDWIILPPTVKVSSMPCADKCPEVPDPDRNYYDVNGKEYNYQGIPIVNQPLEPFAGK